MQHESRNYLLDSKPKRRRSHDQWQRVQQQETSWQHRECATRTLQRRLLKCLADQQLGRRVPKEICVSNCALARDAALWKRGSWVRSA